jgi:hypothetical protein
MIDRRGGYARRGDAPDERRRVVVGLTAILSGDSLRAFEIAVGHRDQSRPRERSVQARVVTAEVADPDDPDPHRLGSHRTTPRLLERTKSRK